MKEVTPLMCPDLCVHRGGTGEIVEIASIFGFTLNLWLAQPSSLHTFKRIFSLGMNMGLHFPRCSSRPPSIPTVWPMTAGGGTSTDREGLAVSPVGAVSDRFTGVT